MISQVRRFSTQQKFAVKDGLLRFADSEVQITEACGKYLNFEYSRLGDFVNEGRYQLANKPNTFYQTGCRNRVFDVTAQALQDKGFRAALPVFLASSYGTYWYWLTMPFAWQHGLCGLATVVSGVASAYASMLNRVQAASFTVMPGGNDAQIVLVSGTRYVAPISDIQIFKVTRLNIQMSVRLRNGDTVRALFDVNSPQMREDLDVEALLGLSMRGVSGVDLV